MRRAGERRAANRPGRRHLPREADRGLSDHVRQRHDGHRRAHHQRPEVGAERRSDDDAERPLVQRSDRRVDVVKRMVKEGDIVIIPSGVPHGWSDIPNHVDYLSFRPSDHILTAGYVHPSIKK